MTPSDASGEHARAAASILAHLDGTISEEELRALDEQLANNPDVAKAFVDLACLEGNLLELHQRDLVEASAADLLSEAGISLASRRRTPNVVQPASRGNVILSHPIVSTAAALACMVLVGLGVAWLTGVGSPDVASPRFAQVVSSVDSLWARDYAPDPEGWIPEGLAKLERGQIELQFGAEVRVVLEAPAEFEVLNTSEVRLMRGKMAARVNGELADFHVHTPMAEVIDLGTEFGVAVEPHGETAIAVFDGKVDVSPEKGRSVATEAQAVRRLNAGEGLLLDRLGTQRRIRSVEDDTFPSLTPTRRPVPSNTPPLIAGIRDNLRDEDSPKFYRVVRGGLKEDALAYVDREHEWNGVDESGIPTELQGADYIMTFNADKAASHFEVVLTVGRPARVYVLFDDRGAKPKWLKTGFEETDLRIGVDEGPTTNHLDYDIATGPGTSVDHVFSIWSRDLLEPGDVTLGPRFGGHSRSMYGIAVVPLPATETK